MLQMIAGVVVEKLAGHMIEKVASKAMEKFASNDFMKSLMGKGGLDLKGLLDGPKMPSSSLAKGVEPPLPSMESAPEMKMS